MLTCVEHPDSDHLHITTVDLGDGVPTQIVCGAPNVAAGQHVVVATVGTKLKGTDKEFYYFNTHLDHIGREARKNSILLIVDKIAEINTQGLPVFLSADFNSPTDNAIFDPLKQALGDARTDCTVTDKSITYNGFGQVEGNPATNNDNEQVIDHIFYKGVRPGTFKVVQPSAIACRPYKDSRPDSWAAISVMVSSDREADHGTFQLVCSEAMRRIGR